MSALHLIQLDRSAYLASVDTIVDPKTLAFADMSLKWWDSHYLWYQQGCFVLSNTEDEHLSYIFYKIDRYRQYLSVHNLFTPKINQRKGYAHELLKMVFELAIKENVKRFKLTSISKSLDFYLELGFIYWGVNSVGDYYCDLPIPKDGLDTLALMIAQSSTQTLLGGNYEKINLKVGENEHKLSKAQHKIFESDKIKMGKSYHSDSLLKHKN